jgi:PfaB family protein
VSGTRTALTIAIVGRACVLPGALDPAALWQAVVDGRDLTSAVPDGRWRMPRERVLCSPDAPQPDRCWSDRGGYVDGFDTVWNPDGFALPATSLAGLDPLVHWLLHCSRAALSELGDRPRGRIGAVFGNLGFPSEAMAAYADELWKTGSSGADPRNRFMSGGTAAVLAEALRLDAGSISLDAACASSLYAIKLACDRLQDGRADVMLAGAVQRADDLFLHIGFAALGALSRSGRSRPFHRDADGLLPAEGCAMLALKRLADARRDGDTIHAVIRGIGLSNDGRGRGLLVPDEDGQQRAMRAAWAQSGLDPSSASLLECHATGTPVGDATELRSSAAVFAGTRGLPIGSLKSNLGHLITVAGAAGVIKTIEAMRAGLRAPTLHIEEPTDALAGTPFRLLDAAEPWPADGPRIAAVSAFGFGGNNAHLVLSQDDPGIDDGEVRPAPPGSLAIVGIGCMVGPGRSRAEFSMALFGGEDLRDQRGESSFATADAGSIILDLAGLRFPPRDLQQALPQQLAMLQVAREALAETVPLPRERTAVLIGMEPDAEVARYGTRWRLGPHDGSHATVDTARDAVIAPLESAGVLGCMPNIPANRLSSQFDLAGPAFTVQCMRASGLHALQIACDALASGEIDAALVGAVDAGCEPVNRAACARPPADAAVALVLKRLDMAERDGDRIHAVLEPMPSASDGDPLPDLADRFGDAGAAQGLLQVVAAALLLHHRRDRTGRPQLAVGDRGCVVPIPGAPPLRLREATSHPPRSETPLPRLRIYSGADREAVIAALHTGVESLDGNARLVIVARDAEFDALRTRALAHLQHAAPAGNAIHYREQPLSGEIAFVFAGAAAAYPGMGRELLQHLPQLQQALAARSRHLATALAWAFDPTVTRPSVLQQLWGASALSQMHLALSEDVLGLQADAWLGYSSGETNALVAAGVWDDPDALIEDMQASGLVDQQLGGDFAAVREQWQASVDWASWNVLAPIDEVRAALAEVERVHLAIINGAADCVIAGDRSGCESVVQRLGRARCLPLDYPLAVHVPEVGAVAREWLQLHHREARPPRRGRVYSTAWGHAYAPDSERCADAILAQADRTLDIRPVVLQAWQDGVRVFVEHGPRGSFGRAIRDILGEREALVVSLDRKGQAIDAVLGAVAAMVAAGVPVQHARLQGLLQEARQLPVPVRPMAFAAHWPVLGPDVFSAGPQRSAGNAEQRHSLRSPPLPNPPPQAGEGAGAQRGDATPAADDDAPHQGDAAHRGDAAHEDAAGREDPALVPFPRSRGKAGMGAIPERRRDAVKVQVMVPAPLLPSPFAAATLAAPSAHATSAVSAAVSDHFERAPVTTAADRSTPLAPSATANALSEYRALVARIADQHMGYLDMQRGAHVHYLQQRTTAQSMLLAAAGSSACASSAHSTMHEPRLHGAASTATPAAPSPSAPASTRLLRIAPAAAAVPRSIPSAQTAPTHPHQHQAPAPTPACTSVATRLPTAPADTPTGPSFTRQQLITHAAGRISDLFGPQFASQDVHARQVRMPKPPLLLADRVLGIDGVAGSMGRGRIWTETDVDADAWYLYHGRMPAGVMIEAGQADLMLISWLGVDALNRGERVYRLLGCELTYHGDLPRSGDTLRFDIRIDGHAAQDEVRLMFFHYDANNGNRTQLSVRKGQAGFFTGAELAASAGCLWTPELQAIVESPRLDPPAVECTRSAFDRAALEAFAAGDAATCFGDGFEFAHTHSRSPSIHPGRMLLLDRVTMFDTRGGPWQRGYLRAELDIDADQWFFDGHFKNDPCMPGTLMFEGCLQAMAVYLACCGHTLRRDGWRFQPVPELPYQLQCRGQVTPQSRRLVTEVFVEEIVAGPQPTLYADLLCTVDGLKAFHARRVALELVPDWPLEALPRATADDARPVAEVDGFRFDRHSLLACAMGRPSSAFGPIYTRFDGPMRVARLPSPPYLFIDRIREVHGPIGVLRAGARVVAEYDIPDDVWYLQHNGAAVMPFAVLLEAALQPCGWLSSYVGSALTVDAELGFRNLDGEGSVLAELTAGAGTLRTEVELTDVSSSAGMIIETFAVRCWLGEQEVYRLRTVFGFFPPEALAAQAGLPPAPAQRELLQRPSNVDIDLALNDVAVERPRLPGPMLRMIDRVDGLWPDRGAAGLGALRAVKDVDPGEWFFKAHFFQDPVQPGSLGLEAMLQALQFLMLQQGMHHGIARPRFESIAVDRAHRWKYRGQVLPHHRQVHTTLEITERGRDERGAYALADASLWADGQRIYEARGLGVRIVSA